MTKRFLWFLLTMVITGMVLVSCGDSSSTEPSDKAPNCEVITPENGSEFTVGSTISIQIEATDEDGSIEKVDLYLNNEMIASLTSAPFNYDWETSNFGVGSYILKAVATDNDELTGESSEISIMLKASNTIPSVTIDSPANGSDFNIGDVVSVEMTAMDSDGTIDKVDLYLNDEMVVSLTNEPFNYNWDTSNFEAGNYNLKAVATDNDGLTGESIDVNVSLIHSYQAPVVSIDSPTDGSSFAIGETVSIEITATDSDGMVDQVDIYVGETMVTSLTSLPFNYNWDTSDFEEGTYSLKAVATDNDGLTTESSMVNVTLTASNEAPMITIDSPANGSDFNIGDMVSVEMTAMDSDGTIDKVDLYLNDEMVVSLTNEPFNYDWDTANLEAGTYSLKAVATDNDGLTGESSNVVVVLNNQVINDGFIFVEGGQFQMGDRYNEGVWDELPVHDVTVNSFYISKYELTQDEYEPVMEENPSHYLGENRPVESLTWYEAIEYCNKLSEMEGLEVCYTFNSDSTISCDFTKNGYRLPTEAEWEYAARGGVHHTDNFRYVGCNEESELGNYAWFGNWMDSTHDVGEKLPNQLGIYDINGNVWEWCWDFYDPDYYPSSPENNPSGPSTGNTMSIRGGGIQDLAFGCRVACRNSMPPKERFDTLGVRIVRSAVQ